MRYRILPYRQGSKSAKALAERLGGKVLKLEGSKFKPRHDDVIINWGNTQPTSESFPNFYSGGDLINAYLNSPWHIRQASNKLLFFQRMKEAGLSDIIPRFFTSQDEIPDDAFPIVCRTVLAGHSGEGIVIADSRSDLVNAPLYVEYVKKQDEYRIHVGQFFQPVDSLHYYEENTGYQVKIISVQRKARRADCPNPNWQVRNHHNGFIFVRNDVSPPSAVTEASLAALRASDLDFGAIDVIWNAQQQRAYVLEINTAPGLEGSTVDDYSRFFRGE